jgi:membrane protein
VIGMLLRVGWLANAAVGQVLGGALTVLVSLLASWLGFLWVLAKLPRRPVDTQSAVRGAVLAAIGFEVLKQVGNIYLGVLRRSPSWTPLGSLLGLFLLLLFSYLAARFLLFMTAWTATARENLHPEPVPVPSPVVIAPVVAVRHRPSFRAAAGLVGMGAVAWMGLCRVLRRLKRT